MSVIALLQPATGCALSASETIRIRVVNLGPAPLPGGSIFSISYTINGGLPVSDTLLMGNPIQPNGTAQYTFQAPADLSQPGVYQIDATITVSNDSNPSNNALGAQAVRNWAPTIGGAVPPLSGSTAAGTLALAGQLGAVLEWQQSEDGERWQSLENTTATQDFAGLGRVTRFRALVQNGPCASALSSDARVAPDAIFRNGLES